MKICEREGCGKPVPEIQNDGVPQRFCCRSCSAKANAAAARGRKLKRNIPRPRTGRGRGYFAGGLE